MSSLYSIGQMNVLGNALERAGFTPEDVTKLGESNTLIELKMVLDGRGPKRDSLIRVERSIRPSYPDWMKEALYEDLEKMTGPLEYDISSVVPWLHDGQKNGGWMTGNNIHDYLKRTDALVTCLGLRDLEEIQKKGTDFFREHFQGKVVFAWKGVVRRRDGRLHVPALCVGGGGGVLAWCWLDDAWHGGYPALRFAS